MVKIISFWVAYSVLLQVFDVLEYAWAGDEDVFNSSIKRL